MLNEGEGAASIQHLPFNIQHSKFGRAERPARFEAYYAGQVR
jgi:hypothetical protein